MLNTTEFRKASLRRPPVAYRLLPRCPLNTPGLGLQTSPLPDTVATLAKRLVLSPSTARSGPVFLHGTLYEREERALGLPDYPDRLTKPVSFRLLPLLFIDTRAAAGSRTVNYLSSPPGVLSAPHRQCMGANKSILPCYMPLHYHAGVDHHRAALPTFSLAFYSTGSSFPPRHLRPWVLLTGCSTASTSGVRNDLRQRGG